MNGSDDQGRDEQPSPTEDSELELDAETVEDLEVDTAASDAARGGRCLLQSQTL